MKSKINHICFHSLALVALLLPAVTVHAESSTSQTEKEWQKQAEEERLKEEARQKAIQEQQRKEQAARQKAAEDYNKVQSAGQQVKDGTIEGGNTQNSQIQVTPNAYSQGQTGGASSAGKGAAAQQLMGVAASAASAAALASPCASVKSSAWACPMMALSVAQGLMSLLGSKGSKDAANGMSSFDWGSPAAGTVPTGTDPSLTTTTGTLGDTYDPNGVNGNVTGTNGTTTPDATTRTTAIDPTNLKKALDSMKQSLANRGVKVSPDGQTVTMPDGKSIPASAMTSDAGMKSAGFSDADIQAAKAGMAKAAAAAENQIKAVSMQAADGGGGGGSGSGGGGYGAGSGGSGLNMKMPWDKKAGDKDKNRVSGMSKKLGGDNIGVAGDDIFEMITRRYKVRDAKDEFLKH